MLRHFLHQHAHVEGAEPAAAIFLRRAHAPHAGGLNFFRDAPVIFFGNFRGVGIEFLLDAELSRRE